jgi:probable O-glycosylation ligase (exosortase A-associated)
MFGYIWYSLMRPDILAFVEVKYPLSLVFAICSLLGSVWYLSQVGVILRAPTIRFLLLLQIPVGLSIAFAIQPDLDIDRYTYYVRNLAILFLIPVLIQTEKDLRQLLFVIALSLGIVGLKFGLFGVLNGGADFSSSSFGYMLQDNNFLALAFATVIPLAWYCRLLTSNKTLKLVLFAIVGGCISGVVMSGSRGGSIALAAGILLLLGKAKRKLAPALFLFALASGAIYLVHDAYTARMSTLRAPEQEASAASRIAHAHAAYGVWMDHPFLGVGFGGLNYAAIAQNYGAPDNGHVAHNTYLQILVDSGTLAFLLFCAALLGAIMRLRRRSKPDDTEFAAMASALATSLTIFAVGATFYSCQRMDLLYILLMCAGSCELIGQRKDEQDKQALAEYDSDQVESVHA